MRKQHFNRREFIKLLGLTPLIFANRHTSFQIKSFNQPMDVESRPNILVLILDAFSSRHSSLYHYHRHTTPNIERFSNRATVFHRHYAAGNFTSPGTASLLTGVYPWTHRAYQVMGSIDETALLANLFSSSAEHYRTFAYTHNPLAFILLHRFQQSIHQLTPISELCLENASLIDRFFRRDYPIAFEVENLLFRNSTYPSGSLFLSPLDDLRRLYMRHSLDSAYRERYPRGISRVTFEAPPGFIYFLLEDAIDWLQKQLTNFSKPFLGYVHLLPPHHPYVTRKEFLNRFDDGREPVTKPTHVFSMGYSQEYLNTERRLYDETIAYVDAEFGRLYDALQNAGILDNTYLILTSDHGEMFERGIWAHNTPTLYEPIVHVPLLISSPGQTQRRDVYTPTSNVDLLPTVCQIAGLPVPAQCEGQVLSLSGNNDQKADRSVYVVEAKENPKNAPLRKATIAMIKAQYKLIYTFGYSGYPETYELYDLERDPEELNNLYNPSGPVSVNMKDELLAKLTAVNQR